MAFSMHYTYTTRELPSIGSSPVIENGTLGLWGMLKIYARPINRELTDIKNHIIFLFFHIFVGGSEHKLDSVKLIYLAGTGIVVDGHDVGTGEVFTKLLDNAFTYNVVGKTSEGLGTNNVLRAVMDKLYHFAC